ncbi:hypothetical protein O181_061612 [Austropuccinia psidii MF-1]|uniref:Uncharacterized protein n=1 Tax=Austropuccinia psidii MF-1 TaxID=1389203 RepID=A0A9Q3EQS3_9BASI|nr:hypothetical protein [Austropuccinia psidii MF-1]
MANIQKLTHGFEIVLFSQVFEEYPVDLPPGQMYCNYWCLAGVPVSGISNDDAKEIELQLFSNTLRSHALKAGEKYYVPVRIAKSPNENTYLGIYSPQYTTYLGPTRNITFNFTNKLHSSGFGVIVSHQEKVLCFGDNNSEAVLSFHICHDEWNPEERQQVNFEVTYITRKKGNSNTYFGLFQIGREVAASGPLIDWDEQTSTWVVLVLYN